MLPFMSREFVAGLCVLLSLGCADAGQGGSQRSRELATGLDGGADAEPCDWYVYWLTMVDQSVPCNWGMVSHDPTIALFRSVAGECLEPTTICGVPSCADLVNVPTQQIVELWGPAGRDPFEVWDATETYECE